MRDPTPDKAISHLDGDPWKQLRTFAEEKHPHVLPILDALVGCGRGSFESDEDLASRCGMTLPAFLSAYACLLQMLSDLGMTG